MTILEDTLNRQHEALEDFPEEFREQMQAQVESVYTKVNTLGSEQRRLLITALLRSAHEACAKSLREAEPSLTAVAASFIALAGFTAETERESQDDQSEGDKRVSTLLGEFMDLLELQSKVARTMMERAEAKAQHPAGGSTHTEGDVGNARTGMYL